MPENHVRQQEADDEGQRRRHGKKAQGIAEAQAEVAALHDGGVIFQPRKVRVCAVLHDRRRQRHAKRHEIPQRKPKEPRQEEPCVPPGVDKVLCVFRGMHSRPHSSNAISTRYVTDS